MLSEKVQGQHFASRVLKYHLENDRLAHTYLFTGEKSAGKEELALAFAAALNCLNDRSFQPCECTSCAKAEKGNHPDLIVVGEDSKARSIKIEEVRQVIGQAWLKPFEGKRKVFIFKEASRLTLDAANALLKILEEPPGHTVFILTVESKANLIDTIQSRSFEIRLKPLGTQEPETPLSVELGNRKVEDYLEDYQSNSRDDIKRMLDRLAGYFYEKLERTADREQYCCVKALELIVESKDALEANVNQKLLVSRLTMQLKKTAMTGKR